MPSQGYPRKPEGIKPFTMVNTLPCQVRAMSSHSNNTLSGQVGVTPHKSEGIEPFNIVNTPPCQVGVTPCKPEGIEPFTTVNSLPCQVGAMSLHPINTPLGPLGGHILNILLSPCLYIALCNFYIVSFSVCACNQPDRIWVTPCNNPFVSHIS